jgi:tetratricopeptide (TPR) repeat protein
MKISLWLLLGSALLAWPTAWSSENSDILAVVPTVDGRTIGIHACQSGESWALGNMETSMPPRFVESINLFLRKKITTVRGFAEALAMRRQAKTPEEKFFAEYWISRSLYGSRMVHVAKDGFALLASRQPSPKTAGIQLAALECLVQIHNIYPAIEIPAGVVARIPEYLKVAKPLDRQNIVWDLATHYVLSRIAAEKIAAPEGERLTSFVAGSPVHEAFIKGVLAAQRNDHSNTISNLKNFVASSNMPNSLQRYVTTAHILLARSYYSVQQFDRAIEQFKKVDRKSNELANSLQEMSWGQLMAEEYGESIGTSITLQAGSLRKTYAPEAPMVMSMAMNEICQFPESIKAANYFKRSYENTYSWLANWEKGGEKENLYKLAVSYLRHQGDTPDQLASEWVRSPTFIADQDEVNLVFDERNAAASLTRWGSKEQATLAQIVIDEITNIKPAFDKAYKIRQQTGEEFSTSLQAHLERLRDHLASYRNMQHAAPIWKTLLASHLKKAPLIEHHLIAAIGADLKSRSERMHDQLEEVAENIELVEVEIYNGASEDIIWQNAHPDFKKIARDMTDDSGNRAPASKVWDWGKASNITEDGAEIWEDELGSFKANMVDNCTSKDKYIAIKAKRH